MSDLSIADRAMNLLMQNGPKSIPTVARVAALDCLLDDIGTHRTPPAGTPRCAGWVPLLGDALGQACGAPAGEVATSKVLASRAAELAQIRTGTVPTPQEGR